MHGVPASQAPSQRHHPPGLQPPHAVAAAQAANPGFGHPWPDFLCLREAWCRCRTDRWGSGGGGCGGLSAGDRPGGGSQPVAVWDGGPGGAVRALHGPDVPRLPAAHPGHRAQHGPWASHPHLQHDSHQPGPARSGLRPDAADGGDPAGRGPGRHRIGMDPQQPAAPRSAAGHDPAAVRHGRPPAAAAHQFLRLRTDWGPDAPLPGHPFPRRWNSLPSFWRPVAVVHDSGLPAVHVANQRQAHRAGLGAGVAVAHPHSATGRGSAPPPAPIGRGHGPGLRAQP